MGALLAGTCGTVLAEIIQVSQAQLSQLTREEGDELTRTESLLIYRNFIDKYGYRYYSPCQLVPLLPLSTNKLSNMRNLNEII